MTDFYTYSPDSIRKCCRVKLSDAFREALDKDKSFTSEDGMVWNPGDPLPAFKKEVDGILVRDMCGLFADCKAKSLDLSLYNTEHVDNMAYLFQKCAYLTRLDLTSFTTCNLYNTQAMFHDCKSLVEIKFGDFNTEEVHDMSGMFCGCESLKELDLSSFSTKKVDRMYAMFKDCKSLTTVDLTSFDMSSVYSAESMFEGCSNLIKLDFSSVNTKILQNTSHMFEGCKQLSSLNLSGLYMMNVLPDTFTGMFKDTCADVNAPVKVPVDSKASKWICNRPKASADKEKIQFEDRNVLMPTLSWDEISEFYAQQKKEKSVKHYVKECNITVSMYGDSYLDKNVFIGPECLKDILVGPGLDFDPTTGHVIREAYNKDEVIILDTIGYYKIRLATDEDIINLTDNTFDDIGSASINYKSFWDGCICVLYGDDIYSPRLIWNAIREFDYNGEIDYNDINIGPVPARGLSSCEDCEDCEDYDELLDFYHDADKIEEGITDENVKSYMLDIGRIPLLSIDEERELAYAIQRGGEEGIRAKDTLIQSNLRAVVAIAKQYQNQGKDLKDLIEEGNMGLIKAAGAFRNRCDDLFICYADKWIRQRIIRALGNVDPLLDGSSDSE